MASVAARATDLAIELLLEAPAAEEPGQCVPVGDLLELVLEAAPYWEATLGAVFTLAREECVVETRVAGEIVFARA